MSSKKFGWGGVVVVGGLAWVLAQGETENPGTINRGTGSGTEVIAGLVRDAKTLAAEAGVGDIAASLGQAVDENVAPASDAQLPSQITVPPNG